ncbi:MAG: hypothetical protein U5O39_10525 [Gammaproteobacteria bacterium]|nr:hypothetical protein [Gammaproteobacteria bacterium]
MSRSKWIRFAEWLAYEKPDEDDPAVLLDWIDDVVDRFSERFELRDALVRRLEEART